jgi:uncharacterized protein YciI
MSQIFAVIRYHAEAWQHGKPLEQQVDWAAHADYMDRLYEQGFFVLVGPLETTDDVLLIVRGESPEQIERCLQDDPWTQQGLLKTRQIAPWTLRLGSIPEPRPG